MDNISQPITSGAETGGLNYVGALLTFQMRNVEAMRLAQQKMLEGVGTLVQRQTEMLQATLRRSFATPTPAPTSAASLAAALADRIDTLKTSMLETQTNLNILSELAARSGGEVATTLQSRLVEALDEVKAVLEHTPPALFTPAGLAAAAAAPPRT